MAANGLASNDPSPNPSPAQTCGARNDIGVMPISVLAETPGQ